MKHTAQRARRAVPAPARNRPVRRAGAGMAAVCSRRAMVRLVSGGVTRRQGVGVVHQPTCFVTRLNINNPFAFAKPFRSASSNGPPPPTRLFCVVGSGPAGMYTVDRLLKHYGPNGVRVDLLDKSPVPFGLVRAGVAPDHQSTKLVQNRFDEILRDARVSFLGNVRLGSDVFLDELTPRYHATVLCYGADGDTKLQIPGEDTLAGVFSARRFVGWVNGDPEIVGDTTFTKEVHKSLTSYSDRNTCVIFGLGNVAVDCARILLRSVEELSATDIARSALETLKQSNVRKVLLIGRRGMAQAAFSPKELRELLQLPDVKVTVFDDALQAEDEEDLVTSRPRRRAVEAIRKAVDVGTDGDNKNLKELQIKFLRSPVALHGSPGGDDGRSVRTAVRSVTLEVNQLVGKSGNRKATGTGATETVDKIAVALRSVGYKSTSGCVNESESDAVSNINGYTRTLVPFDAEKGIVPNSLGRVQQVVSAGMGGGAWFVPGVYVCGWLKRGPKGIIGDNLVCATETVVSLVQDDEKGKLRRPDYRFRNKGILPSLLSKGVEVVDVEGWHKIDLLERQRGAAVGKPREKIVAKREMLQVARGE